MPLVSMNTLLTDAMSQQYGIGYFEAWDIYSLETVLEAAEAERAPVILGFGCMMVASDWLDAGGIEMWGAIGQQVAANATVPVALILNEAQTYEQALRGIDAGFNTVMLDSSDWEPAQAIETVARLVEVAHAANVAVEAELGRLPDAVFTGGVDHSHARLTDPDEARQFVEQTGVDLLGVSIGNVHIMTDGYASVDLARLADIHAKISIPLVIHGGTSFPPDAVPGAVANGAVKFNVGTILKSAFLDGIRETVSTYPARVNVHDVMGSHKETDLFTLGQARMTATVQRLMRLYGSSGRAI